MIEKEDILIRLYNRFLEKRPFSSTYISYLDFLKLVYRLAETPDIMLCYNESTNSPENYLSVLKLLQNERIIDVIDNNTIEFRNKELIDLFFKRSSEKEIFKKLIESFELNDIILEDKDFLSNTSLLKFINPVFQVKTDYFQFPCSILSSLKRISVIINNVLLQTQQLLFLGDDDLISVLCKLIAPELEIHVIDIDLNVIEILKGLSNKFKFKNFTTHHLDLNEDNRNFEFLAKQFSIIHTDPPYVPEFLRKFLIKVIYFASDRFCQIFLNGLFDYPGSIILNDFSYENKLICSHFFKSFNRYPVVSMDSHYVEWTRNYVKTTFQYDFSTDQLRRAVGTSNLYVFEKSYSGAPQN